MKKSFTWLKEGHIYKYFDIRHGDTFKKYFVEFSDYITTLIAT